MFSHRRKPPPFRPSLIAVASNLAAAAANVYHVITGKYLVPSEGYVLVGARTLYIEGFSTPDDTADFDAARGSLLLWRDLVHEPVPNFCWVLPPLREQSDLMLFLVDFWEIWFNRPPNWCVIRTWECANSRKSIF